MKVLHVIPSLSPILGGPTKVALKIVKAIRNQGIEAEIVSTNNDKEKVLDVPLDKRIYYQDVPVWFLSAFPYPLGEYIFSTSLTKWLWQNVNRFDILDNHYLFSYAPTCAGVIARYYNVPYTVRTQGQLTPWALQQSFFKKQLYSMIVERHNLKSAAAIHCTTFEEAEDVRKFGINTQTITLPLGVDPPEILPAAKAELHRLYNIPQERQVVLFLSRLHYKKRPDLLINSLSKVVAINPNVHLIIAGSGEANYVNYLQQLVQDCNLSDRVTFSGFVTGNKKNLLLQGSDIFALPSYSENFGIVVAEAMIAGLPVIITPGIQISSEIASAKAGIIINSETELIAAIATLLNNLEMRSQLSQNAINLATQKYSWEKIATQLISFYTQIIDRQAVS